MYVLSRQDADVSIVRHKDELFIIAKVTNLGWRGSRGLNTIKMLVGGISNKILRQDLIVWHLSNHDLRKFICKGVRHGAAFSNGGSLYYISASKTKVRDDVDYLRWTDKGFIKLDTREASHMNTVWDGLRNNFDPLQDWIEVNHKTIVGNSMSTGINKTTVQLRGDTYTLIVRSETDRNKTYWQSFSLQASGTNTSEWNLLVLKNKPQKVSLEAWTEIAEVNAEIICTESDLFLATPN